MSACCSQSFRSLSLKLCHMCEIMRLIFRWSRSISLGIKLVVTACDRKRINALQGRLIWFVETRREWEEPFWEDIDDAGVSRAHAPWSALSVSAWDKDGTWAGEWDDEVCCLCSFNGTFFGDKRSSTELGVRIFVEGVVCVVHCEVSMVPDDEGDGDKELLRWDTPGQQVLLGPVGLDSSLVCVYVRSEYGVNVSHRVNGGAGSRAGRNDKDSTSRGTDKDGEPMAERQDVLPSEKKTKRNGWRKGVDLSTTYGSAGYF